MTELVVYPFEMIHVHHQQVEGQWLSLGDPKRAPIKDGRTSVVVWIADTILRHRQVIETERYQPTLC